MSASTARDLSITVDRGLAQKVSSVHGANPVFLIEKITRERILDCIYWKKDCYHLNILTLLDQAVDLRLIGTYSNMNKTKPTKFICLLLKLLQLQPPEDILLHLLNQTQFKYLTALIALYIRMTFDSVKVYSLLEKFYEDRRKLIYKDNLTPDAKILYMDEYIDNLLSPQNKFADLILPRLVNRQQLEDNELIEPRISSIQSEFEDMLSDNDSDSDSNSDSNSDSDNEIENHND
ncbi:hypothetical protein CANARDRAFT_27249 [[Candida] arabinofermentans NRRL YB-2248]|uniref:Pre-mRNA-splicing factor 38 n=1 Tax=[Candida] arabinofermentans NRRL YB-2248 TaxID=983967 RepID=A0A1E4T544_9ASCO|nr:hypothetical protein CANARDRAFT_27249 [[Candida] arabinofermentans NRRL YB-2248]